MLALCSLLYRQCHFSPIEILQLAFSLFAAGVKVVSPPLVDPNAGIVKYP